MDELAPLTVAAAAAGAALVACLLARDVIVRARAFLAAAAKR